MEVMPGEKPMVRNYWPRFKRRAAFVLIVSQIILAGAATFLLVSTDVIDPSKSLLLVSGVLIGGLIINIPVFVYLMLPFKTIVDALTHVSGEPTTIMPPNPNHKLHKTDGMGSILQLIYSLAATRSDNDEETEPSTAISRKTLQTALDQSSASLVIMNEDGEISYASKNAPIVTDKTDTKQLQLMFEDEVDLSFWLKDCQERLVHSEKQWLRVPSKIVGAKGRRIFDVTASYEKGSKSEVVLMLFDRTDSYQPEDDQLDFISFAAHELRGPITVIRGYLDVIQDELDEILSPDQKTLISRLVVSSNRLSSYINNILNASRFDRRHMNIRPEERTVAEIYDIVQNDMQLRATAQNRLLAAVIPADLPTIAADPSSLSEVFSNLIDNAIKYSHEGGTVTVRASAEGSFVRVEVIDHGIGIPSSVINNLFHKFYRSHRSRETVAGTGIGLYICKSIIESHGGTIEVKSQDGRGSTFSFTVPTYASVADKIAAHEGTNQGLIRAGDKGWIKNHAKFRG